MGMARITAMPVPEPYRNDRASARRSHRLPGRGSNAVLKSVADTRQGRHARIAFGEKAAPAGTQECICSVCPASFAVVAIACSLQHFG